MKLGTTKHSLIVISRLVTASILSPLTIAVAVTPSIAATLASSGAAVVINNFSHNPLDVLTFTDTTTFTSATSGQVAASADAVATFTTIPPSAYNLSFSNTSGDGSNYFGFAESTAAVIGYNFSVGEQNTFSFDFQAALALNTSITDPSFETASATGNLSFQLYDTTNSSSWQLLDYFTLSGNLATPGNVDFLRSDQSNSISFNSGTDFNSDFGGTQEFANAFVDAQFSRTFDKATNLTLVEVKTNRATVQAPEPSSVLGLLCLGLAGLGYKVKRKLHKSAD